MVKSSNSVKRAVRVLDSKKSQQQAFLEETRAELFLFLDLTPCTYSTRFGTVLFARLSLKSENVLRLVKKKASCQVIWVRKCGGADAQHIPGSTCAPSEFSHWKSLTVTLAAEKGKAVTKSNSCYGEPSI